MGCDRGEADDPVGAGDDGRVVRDDQHRSAVVGDRAEPVDDEGDPLGVEVRGRFVRDQDVDMPHPRREQRPRDGESLAFAARQFSGPPRLGVVEADRGQRRTTAVGRRRGTTERDGFVHGRTECCGMLGDRDDRRPPSIAGQVADRHAADLDAPRTDRRVTGDGGEDRRLPRTGRSDERDHLARSDVQVDRTHPMPPDRIGDHQGLDVEATGRDAPGAVRGLRQRVDLLEVVDGVRPGGGGVERCTDAAKGERALRCEEEHHERGGQRDRPVGQTDAGGDRDQRDRQRRQQLEDQRGQERDAECAHDGSAVVVGDLADPVDLRLCPAEEPQCLEADEHVVEV